jgi:DNA replication protein DnaD
MYREGTIASFKELDKTKCKEEQWETMMNLKTLKYGNHHPLNRDSSNRIGTKMETVGVRSFLQESKFNLLKTQSVPISNNLKNLNKIRNESTISHG